MKKDTFFIFLMILALFFWTDNHSYSKTSFSVGEILISNPRIITQQNDKKDIALVFEIINKSKNQESLISTRILTAENFLFDEILDIGPGEEIQFKRFMKYDKIRPSEHDLYVGDRIPIDLFFKNNGSILVFAEVISREN